ncbi:TPA: hypothetical protein ACPV0G_003656 [Vibrio parahaemolyticus]|uniref:hypothetical protein n=1 Tax=Vibrio TaxID=662 RepID=UPI001F18699C|nr:hypothetical protein [Vibrio parahaemolyticus]EGR0059250.1 hypothetical protein [Vibrio vulnificus]MCG0026592.1 hypothetical protein [Vibrio parahaemolyticus]MCR9509363.1 hypothetical protein [Vibrio parahaemolyticus]MCS0119427.1 hypothetical protein [Vibrio parahaemolyticus]MCU8116052.1 hypothetical protein [Vibrio vulnificus]
MLSFKTKPSVWPTRFALAFYLMISFFYLYLTYDVTSYYIENLKEQGDISSSVAFSMSTFIELLYLMMGVVIGNVGWDRAKNVKEYGFWGGLQLTYCALMIAIVSTLFSAVAKTAYNYLWLEEGSRLELLDFIVKPLTDNLWPIVFLGCATVVVKVWLWFKQPMLAKFW